MQRDVIARGVFPSTADLARRLRRYINAYSKDAQPFRGKYSRPSRPIRHGKTISATSHQGGWGRQQPIRDRPLLAVRKRALLGSALLARDVTLAAVAAV